MNKTARGVLGGLFALAMAANIAWVAWVLRPSQAKKEEKHEEAKRLSHDAEGNAVLTIDKEMQERSGLKVGMLEAATLGEEVVAYGRFQEDPSRSFTVRSPITGVLRRAPGREWPGPGERLADAAVVGQVEPRFAPLDRVDLQSRLVAARAEIEAGASAVEASRAAFERAKTLNAEEKNVSDRQLQEAAAKLKAEEARLKAATETAASIEASLAGTAGATGPRPLAAEPGGEVVEVLAQPGEAVESGQALLRVARFDRLIARAALPAGGRIAGTVASARIVALGQEDVVLKGERIATAAAADPQLLGEAFLFRVEAPAGLRPGMPLTAWIARPGDPQAGVIVPRSAIVRVEGESWVYVQTAADKFTRRELEHARPVEKGWFTTELLKPGDKVVVAGAQMLLSEELKSKIGGED